MKGINNILQIAVLCKCVESFAFSPISGAIFKTDANKLGLHHVSTKQTGTSLYMSELDDREQAPAYTYPPPPFKAFPVISRLSGIEWTGACRYVGADLVPLSKMKLSGGVKYDIEGSTVTLSSFLTFPNGKTREMVMTGEKDINSTSPSMTLRSVEEGGPISMKVTELEPDTLLINEVEEATGKTILTASLSIVQGPKGKMELVQVSHEVSDSDGSGTDVIEGHQVWRLSGGPIQFEDFDYRGTTGR
jgi:hypothetical protein